MCIILFWKMFQAIGNHNFKEKDQSMQSWSKTLRVKQYYPPTS